jgi:hypothetical protein
MKDVVTMKKISMMNTMSSIGVMLISASSSDLCFLRIAWTSGWPRIRQSAGPETKNTDSRRF